MAAHYSSRSQRHVPSGNGVQHCEDKVDSIVLQALEVFASKCSVDNTALVSFLTVLLCFSVVLLAGAILGWIYTYWTMKKTGQNPDTKPASSSKDSDAPLPLPPHAILRDVVLHWTPSTDASSTKDDNTVEGQRLDGLDSQLTETGSGGVWSGLPQVTHVYGQKTVTLSQPSEKEVVTPLQVVPAKTIKYSFGDVTEILGTKASAKQYVSGVYDIKYREREIRGRALIINIILCSCDSSNENESCDTKDMETLFNFLGYKVTKKDVKKDSSHNDILQIFQTDIGQYDHSQCDSFICCVLAFKCKNHRQDDRIPWKNDCFKYDGKPFESTGGITANLSGIKCSTLKGKPKIFFIQASRTMKEKDLAALDVIPSITDFVFCYQTPETEPAYGSPGGTTFVQEICKALTQYARFVPFMEIMTRMHKAVQEQDGKREPYVSPETTSSLRKNFYFF